MVKYDYLIVGAGLFGATIAERVHRAGKSVLVIDKRSHIAGNVYTETQNNINVHKYGAHIFHTDYDDVCREADADMYENKKRIKAKYNLGKIR